MQRRFGRQRRLEIRRLAVEAAAAAAPGRRGEGQPLRSRRHLAGHRALVGKHVVEAGAEIALDLAPARIEVVGEPGLGREVALAAAVEAVVAPRIGRLAAGLAGLGRLDLGPLQQRVALQLGIDIGREVEMRELQKLDRLQELRRHHQGLALAHLEPLQQTHQPAPHAAPRFRPGSAQVLLQTPDSSFKPKRGMRQSDRAGSARADPSVTQRGIRRQWKKGVLWPERKGRETGGRDRLEHFPTKWMPVRRRKCGKTKDPESFAMATRS